MMIKTSNKRKGKKNTHRMFFICTFIDQLKTRKIYSKILIIFDKLKHLKLRNVRMLLQQCIFPKKSFS